MHIRANFKKIQKGDPFKKFLKHVRIFHFQ